MNNNDPTQRSVLLLQRERTDIPAWANLERAGWRIQPISDIATARSHLRSGTKVGLIVVSPGVSGALDEYESLLQEITGVEWIALVQAEQLAADAVRQFIRSWCYDYHTFPIEAERLHITLGHALGMAQLQGSNRHSGADQATHGLIGDSRELRTALSTIAKISQVDAPVLITGESGTGKELAARAIHDRSMRRHRPFQVVNCGAIPPNLIQSELFGHEKGAFTGASQRRIGRIESATGGTLFLDEIGDLPHDLQVNLLRFLQNRMIQRVGSTEELAVDVRVVAATNIDLHQAVADNRFREDLFYRLNVLCIEMPPLRARHGDPEQLAHHFFEHFSSECPTQVRGFSLEALEAIRRHDWAGNVRELINRVRRAVVMCDARTILPQDLGLAPLRRRSPARPTLDDVREQAEQQAIETALAENAANISRTARQLGVSRVTLYRLMEKYGICPKTLRQGMDRGNVHMFQGDLK